MKKSLPAEQVMAYSFVGNLGCIRFPAPVRKVSGIKRGDRLAVTVGDAKSLVLEKLDVPGWIQTGALELKPCNCSQPPESCNKMTPGLVTVGWSYVQLKEELAIELGFLPDTPVKMVGELSKITVTAQQDLKALAGVEKMACPP